LSRNAVPVAAWSEQGSHESGAAVRRRSRTATLRSVLLLMGLVAAAAAAPVDEFPPTLRATGYGAPELLAFSPQYPLWSDGADKERYIALPPGTSIDASNPDAWDFPRGTRLWKTFAHGGRPVETRYIERAADGRWRFASYVWRVGGGDAELAPRGGASVPVREAVGGRYVVPSRDDCLACHGGAAAPVLGFSALQLSPRRSAPTGTADLQALIERRLVRHWPPTLAAPRIVAATARERAVLGNLHGNCAHCHHAAGGQVPVPLNLMQRVADPERSAADVLRSLLDAPTRYRHGDGDAFAVVPGDAQASVLVQRMRSRDGRTQMPPLATDRPDARALERLERWIDEDLPRRHP
jgi:mono/diheme cytochrome c family protein